jgi:type IV secretion system protein VirD4
VYETALTALGCLESEAVARYVTPPDTWLLLPGLEPPPDDPSSIVTFDPWRFVVGYTTSDDGTPLPYDTLYALTREGAGTAAPVAAALVDHLLLTTAEAATAHGGRVDPPVRAVLDEAANICPIKNLPDLYSYFGSMSIQVMTFLQSEAQGVALWGKAGMDKLWSAATIKMIGAGVHDDAFCERISRLVGHHDVPTWSDQRGRGGGSITRSTRRERILEASDIAELTKQQAVLISTGRKSGLIRLLPWYQESDADLISSYGAQTTDEVRRAAIATLGPKNPLPQQLAQQYGTADDHA